MKNNLLRMAIYGVFLALIIFGGAISCSHTRPYTRNDVSGKAPIKFDTDSIRQRILLIGDAGAPGENEAVLEVLSRWAKIIPENTFTAFLGDNIYPAGLPVPGDPRRMEAERRLLAQLGTIAGSGGRGLFIPGNHDWGSPKNLTAIREQEKLVEQTLGDTTAFRPHNGCPGPEKIDLDGLRLIVIDTQWLIGLPERPKSDCPLDSREAVLDKIEEYLVTAGHREVIVLGHHPLATNGPHGGFFSWKDHIFPLTNIAPWMWVPLPGIGSLYPLVRWHIVKSSQDMSGSHYRQMVADLSGAFSKTRPLAYACGHEHNLQVLEGGTAVQFVLVSGAGSRYKMTEVGDDEDTLFAHLHPGFMCLDLFKDGRVLLQVVEPGKREVTFQMWLK